MKKIFVVLLFVITWTSCNRVSYTANLPGDKDNFKPVEALPKVSKFVNKDQILDPDSYTCKQRIILSIEAVNIKPNGTMDLEAENEPYVLYYFVAPCSTANTEPVTKSYLTKVRIFKPYTDESKVQARDLAVTEYVSKHHGGMEKSKAEWYPESKGEKYNYQTITENIEKVYSARTPVSFAKIWQKAIEAGAPSEDVVATIEYHALYGYTFKINNTDYQYQFDLDGSLITEN